VTALDADIPATLEFWFDFGSTYSYLSMMRIEALAERHDVAIAWKPFLLGAIFKSFGWSSSPFVLQKAKGIYTWRDMARQCEKYGLPWTQPSQFPRNALLPMRVALIGAEQPWIGAFCKRLMQINFVEDRDINESAVVDVALTELGFPAQEIIVAAQSEENKRDMRRQTDEALRRGVFGAPTFFAGTEMFWGNDRLEDALLLAAKN
jgi:2-hydroxychromene-2-carboxylate isomerase